MKLTPRIGHIHLSVSNLDSSIKFYEQLGFRITAKLPGAAFMSSGSYHHEIGLNTWGDAKPSAEKTTGLYHVAILYPTRKQLKEVIISLARVGVAIEGTADHGVSESFYLTDPDNNGIELYFDKPKKEWPRDNGKLVMYTRPLDMKKYL